STAETIGKTPGKDSRSKKATYPAFYGVDLTREHLRNAHRSACDSLDRLDKPTKLLRAIADFLLERQA
ncbi:MAG: polyprenyl synthetase family protein, partial [Pyrinomonadaceae bacterium]